MKAVLTEPFTAEAKREELERGISYYQPRTWAFWRNLVMYFCVFSVVGHWMEIAYCVFMNACFGIVEDDSLVWGDPLYPFLVYGVGVVVCVVGLVPLRERLVAKRSTLFYAGVQFS